MSSSPEFDAPAPEALAALLPAFEFELLIAKSASGAVYKARQKSLDREVAIKILPRERMADPAFKKAFETEARAIARLNHPNLISIYDSGEVDGMAYLVMEFVPGKSLYRSAYGRKIDPAQGVEIVIGICKGLAAAHEGGLVHRAVSPANILLNRKAEPKIGDFGLAHRSEAEDPGYTAPEVVRQPNVADRRSDLYAVGIILYELLTGTRQRPDSPALSVASGVDISLDRIWQRATNPNPGLRYPDGNAFALDLSEWLKRRHAIATHSGNTSRLTTGDLPRKAAPPVRRAAERQEVVVTKSGGNFGGTALNLFLFAVLAGGGYLAWKKFSEKPGTAPAPVTEVADESSPTGGSASGPARRGAGESVKIPEGGARGQDSPFGSTSPRGSSGNGFSPFGSTSPDGRSPGSSGGALGSTAGSNLLASASDPLTVKARELVATAEKERRKQLADNVSKFKWDLDSWQRASGKSEQASWQPHLDQLKGAVSESRVPVSVPEGAIKLSPQMSKIAAAAAEKQQKIDADYAAQMTRYRDLYVSKMKDIVTEAEKAGKTAATESSLVGVSGDLDSWVSGLGGELKPANPTVGRRSGGGLNQPSGPDNPFGRPIEE